MQISQAWRLGALTLKWTINRKELSKLYEERQENISCTGSTTYISLRCKCCGCSSVTRHLVIKHKYFPSTTTFTLAWGFLRTVGFLAPCRSIRVRKHIFQFWSTGPGLHFAARHPHTIHISHSLMTYGGGNSQCPQNSVGGEFQTHSQLCFQSKLMMGFCIRTWSS